MKDIKYMNFEELIKNFGINLNMKYMRYVFRDSDVADEFYAGFKMVKESNQYLYIRNFINNNFGKMDKEAYAFLTLKTMVDDNAKDPGVYSNCVEALRDSEYHFFDIDDRGIVRRHTVGDLLEKYNGQKIVDEEFSVERKRIDEIKDQLDLKDLFSFKTAAELNEYCNNVFFTNLVARSSLIDYVAAANRFSVVDRVAYFHMKPKEFNKQVGEIGKRLGNKNMDVVLGAYAGFLEKFPEDFDIDKVLLIAGFRANWLLENADMTEEQNKKLTNVLRVCFENIKNKRVFVNGIEGLASDGESRYDYSYNALRQACKRINENGMYFPGYKEDEIHDRIEQDPTSIGELDLADLRMMKFEQDDINYMATGRGNLEFLISNG